MPANFIAPAQEPFYAQMRQIGQASGCRLLAIYEWLHVAVPTPPAVID
jgi:hypothetical protein